MRETLAQFIDDGDRLIHRERGLGQPNKLLVLQEIRQLSNALDAIHKVGNLRCFAGGSFHFLMSFVANQEDVIAIALEALGFLMHLGYQWARGVQR